MDSRRLLKKVAPVGVGKEACLRSRFPNDNMPNTRRQKRLILVSHANPPIYRMPVEIITLIFHFVGAASHKDPYPYLRLSWVCHHWREVLLHDSKFWSVMRYNDRVRLPIMDEMFRRSQSRKLDVYFDAWLLWVVGDWFRHFQECIFFDTSRIRTLSFRYTKIFPYSKLSELSFPQLENLSLPTFAPNPPDRNVLVQLIATSRLRYLSLDWDTLLILNRLKLFKHLFHIEWLNLSRATSNKPLSNVLLSTLTKLPNLQVLNLTLASFQSYNYGAVIRLPKLRILSLDLDHCNFRAVESSNLDSVCVLRPGTYGCNKWALLDKIDLSSIEKVRISIGRGHPCIRYRGDEEVQDLACISGAEHSAVDCSSFMNFHRDGLTSRAVLDNDLILPPKNSFHIPIWLGNKGPSSLYPLEQLRNLVEITMDYSSQSSDSYMHLPFLEAILKAADTIVILDIKHGHSLVEVCKVLMKKGIVPRLERLTYHNSQCRVSNTSFISPRMKTVQNARLEASSQPLKVLELENFSILGNRQIREIEALGITFIQSS